MKTIKNIYVFPNLMVAVFDENGEQIPELQECLLSLYAKFLLKQGVNPETVVVVLGNETKWRLFQCSDGSWNQEKVNQVCEN